MLKVVWRSSRPMFQTSRDSLLGIIRLIDEAASREEEYKSKGVDVSPTKYGRINVVKLGGEKEARTALPHIGAWVEK